MSKFMVIKGQQIKFKKKTPKQRVESPTQLKPQQKTSPPNDDDDKKKGRTFFLFFFGLICQNFY